MMNANNKSSYTGRQLAVLFALILLNALLAILYYLLIPPEGLAIPGYTQEATHIPRWLLGLANAGIILVNYSLAGMAGYWFAQKLGLPGVYRPGAGWRSWLLIPLLVGLVLGVTLVVADRIFTPWITSAFATMHPEVNWQGFPHPQFPLSIIASASAAIGEEILFRSFVLGLWAFLLNLILLRWNAIRTALWIANVLAALAISTSHLATAMILTGTASSAELPAPLLLELFLLNGILGLVAGERYFRDGWWLPSASISGRISSGMCLPRCCFEVSDTDRTDLTDQTM